MKKVLATLSILGVIGALLLSGQPRANAEVSLQPGDLIRGETYTAVYYYGNDGFRYVFPNFATYKTWFGNDFSDVVWITDAQLANIQIGGNVTYKPGGRMIKINTDPKTYAPSVNGTLRWITSEAVAVALYGPTWNTQIDDIPDGFFTNYQIGDPITTATDFNRTSAAAAATSINVDKGLHLPVDVSVTDTSYAPNSITIEAGRTVRFTNNGTEAHTVTGDDLGWGTGTMQPGQSYVQQFDTVKTYTFFDSYNSQLTGAVFVQ
ncbi:TPA: hypothetical protein DEB00_03520 [Candidatus Uhrbacteria bacterium]|nr:hypothetical protein [Candidatus Uhrbacteria bacterium]